MKILYFHQHFSTPSGSTGTRSYEMARRLIARGHHVTIVCGTGFLADTGLKAEPISGIRRGSVEGIEVVEICLPYSNYDSLLKRTLVFFKFALKSVRIALQTKYDILYATSTPLTAGIPGIVMRVLKSQKKFVFEVRDLWPELPKAMGVVTNPAILWGMLVLEKLTYVSMHAGVALSPGIRDGMCKGIGAKKTVALVPNGCDLEMFRPASSCPDRTTADREPVSISQKGIRCIFTGAHGIANGLDAVLDVAGVLKKRKRPDIKLYFIGDGKLKPHLKARAARAGLDNCQFLDPIPKTELTGFLRRMDVGMMILDNVPSFYYGTSPNKFFDYIASGLPVINNYPGWLADLITKHRCGFAVPPGDPDAFADGLIRLAENPELRYQMGRNCRKLAEREFDRNLLADNLISHLESCFYGKQTSDRKIRSRSGPYIRQAG